MDAQRTDMDRREAAGFSPRGVELVLPGPVSAGLARRGPVRARIL